MDDEVVVCTQVKNHMLVCCYKISIPCCNNDSIIFCSLDAREKQIEEAQHWSNEQALGK